MIALTACGGSDSTTPPSSSQPTASSTPSTTTFGPAGNARLKVEAQLRRYLRQQQLSRARVDCVVRRLRRTVSAGQIEELAGGRASPPVARAVARAGGACALASP